MKTTATPRPLPVYKTQAGSEKTLLTRVLALVRKGWTQGVMARDENGKEVDWESPRACLVCLEGAVERSRPLTRQIVREARERLSEHAGDHPWSYNDTVGRKKREVVKMLKELVESMK